MFEAELRLPGLEGATRLGGGGFSTVYRARQDRFDRDVAVKVLDVRRLDDATRRRFERECAAMGRLSHHPHVVTVYDSGITPDGRPYLLSELCPGGSLADRLERCGPLPVEDAVQIGAQVADALAAAHAEGIVHRDVKPANVLFGSYGQAALADFGLSVRPDLDLSRGLDALSPAHAAPETHERGDSGPEADVYSLGSTVHTLLAGSPPFALGRGETPLQHAHRVLTEPPPELLRPDVPLSLRSLLGRMLAKEGRLRPTAAEVADALHSMGSVPPPAAGSPDPRHGETTGLRPTPAGRASEPATAPGTPSPAHGAAGEATTLRPWGDAAAVPPRRSRRVLVGACTLGGVVLLGAGGLWAVHQAGAARAGVGPPPAAAAAPGAGSTAAGSTAGGSKADATVAGILLDAPTDGGSSVTLRWHGPAGWQYAIIVAAQTGDRSTRLAGAASSSSVPVDPGAPYCFLVQGTDGSTVVQSAPVAIRGATCHT